MKKIIKNRMVLCIVVGICCLGIGVYAGSKYQASEVIYNASDGSSMTVNEALNDIYNIKKIGNATSSNILSGKTAVVQGNKVTGTMTNYSNQGSLWINTDNGKFYNNVSHTYSNGTTTNEMVVFYSKHKGYFDNTTKFLLGEKSGIQSKIRSGETFLGVTGTYTSDATATAADIANGKTAYVNGNKVTGTLNAISNIEKITHLTYSNGIQSSTSSISSSNTYTFTKDYNSVQIVSFISSGNGVSDISGKSVTIQLNNGNAVSADHVTSGQTYTFVTSSYAIRIAHMVYTYSLNNIKSGDVVKINYSVSYPSGGTQAHFDSILYGA